MIVGFDFQSPMGLAYTASTAPREPDVARPHFARVERDSPTIPVTLEEEWHVRRASVAGKAFICARHEVGSGHSPVPSAQFPVFHRKI